MIEVVEIENTCGACPAQWEGKTDDGREVYVRYRNGILRVDIDSKSIYERSYPEYNSGDGCMNYDELRLNTYRVVLWPENEL